MESVLLLKCLQAISMQKILLKNRFLFFLFFCLFVIIEILLFCFSTCRTEEYDEFSRFQSHESEMDYSKFPGTEEKIMKIKWLNEQSLVTGFDRTIKLWTVAANKNKMMLENTLICDESAAINGLLLFRNKTSILYLDGQDLGILNCELNESDVSSNTIHSNRSPL